MHTVRLPCKYETDGDLFRTESPDNESPSLKSNHDRDAHPVERRSECGPQLADVPGSRNTTERSAWPFVHRKARRNVARAVSTTSITAMMAQRPAFGGSPLGGASGSPLNSVANVLSQREPMPVD
jgi:hypothetical protein